MKIAHQLPCVAFIAATVAMILTGHGETWDSWAGVFGLAALLTFAYERDRS